MQSPLIQRARILLEQKRYVEAKNTLGNLLTETPDDAEILGMYALTLLELREFEAAKKTIEQAIHLNPNRAYPFYLRAHYHLQKEQYDAAENDLKAAMQIDPAAGDYYALMGSIRLRRKKFKEAFEWANQALALDPENISALNVRSTAALKLQDLETAEKTIEGALAEDPNNPYTHTTYGWNLLEKGDAEKALMHFQEALKYEPGNAAARSGMLQALKAKYLIYRWFLKYAFWMGNMSANAQWAVILGVLFGHRFLRSISESVPALKPLITPILILISVFALSTWFISPISNLFLRLNSYGKHLLTIEQIKSSNWVGIGLSIAVLGGLIFLVTNDNRWLSLCIFGIGSMFPTSTMFNLSRERNQSIIKLASILLLALGILAVFVAITSGSLFNLIMSGFVFGIIGFQFLSNFLLIREDNV